MTTFPSLRKGAVLTAACVLPSLLALSLVGCGGGGSTASGSRSMAAQIRPSRILLATGGSTTFNALFSGAPPTTVRWTISGGGSLDNTGTTSAEFVAGSTPGSYTITLLADGPNNAETAQATATIQIASASAGNPPAPPPSDPTPSNPPPPANPTPPNPPPANPTPSNPPPPANPTPPNPPPSNPPPATNSTARLFTSSAAAWLYSAPTGAGLNISSIARNLPFGINSHQQGFDYPVQYTDGAHGCTNFNDTGHWGYNDQFCVPNPANGFWPSVGGWGANDGHLVVVDTATGDFYDFWKLYANGAGQPTSNNVGQIVKGNLHTSAGGPGTTAAQISGLAGDIMPGELDCATCLNHALSVVVPGSMNSSQLGHQAPVTHTDGSVPGGIFREGAKIRLDPGLNLSSIQASTAAKAIMRALQLYGAVITDQTGGNGVSFYTSLPTDPDLTGLNQIGQHLWIYY